MRIVSLLPSATEMLCVLGLRDSLVGVTHECDYPASVADLPQVTRSHIPKDARSAAIDAMVREQLATSTSLYSLDLPSLEALRPDLIVTQALCDVCAVAEDEVLAAARRLPGEPRVINLEPMRLAEVFDALEQVAEAAAVQDRAAGVIGALRARVDAVAARTTTIHKRPRVAFLEWLDPPFSGGHWNPELVARAGGEEVLGAVGEASRTLSWEEIVAQQPEVVFVSCCGFDLARSMEDVRQLHAVPAWLELPAVRNGRVYVVDGSQYFSRPGPRLVDSLEIMAHSLHPEVHPLPAGLEAALRIDQAPNRPRR